METLLQVVPDCREAEGQDDPEPPSLLFPELPVLSTIVSRRRRGINPSAAAVSFYRRFFPGSQYSDWQDWEWQFRNRITDAERLSRIVTLSDREREALADENRRFPFAITPYYASLLSPHDPSQPVRRMTIPVPDEAVTSPGESADPLSEDNDSPVHGLVHRYPDRVLFLTTETCSVFCRYCTRSRIVGDEEHCGINLAHWKGALQYIREHAEIRDVLLSGGDPLTLSNERLEWLLKELRAIRHVEVIRIGTKVPVVLPQRITAELTAMLKKYHPVYMSLHFSHPSELTQETREACARLADAGIPLGSQTVLLKGINDDPQTMRALMTGLMKNRVRPYYLYQCDMINGSAHFRTSVETGINIIENLRGHISGYAVPHYVIDAPGGGGKIPLLPDYDQGRGPDGEVLLRNYEDKLFAYPDGGV